MSRLPDNDLEYFVNIWNELFLASMFIFSDEKITVHVALNSFISKAGISWDVLSAGLVLSLLPTMIVFAFAQRYIIAGLTEGAIIRIKRLEDFEDAEKANN